MNIFTEAGKLQDEGEAFAVATIISAKGSTPRSTAKMIVKNDGSIIGTIGGGLAEAFIIKEALEAIQENKPRIVEYTLNSDAAGGIQMLCGGKLEVFIETVQNRPQIMIVGAGHVGLALSRLVELLGYKLSVVDERAEFANPDRYPKAAGIYTGASITEALDKAIIDRNTYIIIVTKDSDYDALKKVILSDAAYIGMIGSKRKVAVVMGKLESEGIAPDRILSVHAPVGLDIGSETPEEIALSIMAEILKVRNCKSGRSLKELCRDE